MTKFKEKAKETLDNIFNIIESKYKDYEVDFEDENLRIDSLKNQTTYIISIHAPTSQIWLSSPVSGAHHFEMLSSDSMVWISTRDKSIKLIELIEKEFNER